MRSHRSGKGGFEIVVALAVIAVAIFITYLTRVSSKEFPVGDVVGRKIVHIDEGFMAVTLTLDNGQKFTVHSNRGYWISTEK